MIELAPHLIAREDEDVSSAVAEILRDEDIQIYVNSRVVGVAQTGQRHRGASRPRWSRLANRWIAPAHGHRAAPEHR